MSTTNWTDKVGGRKFIVTLYSLISITGLLYFKSIDQETFKAILVAVVLVYISGNVGQKAFTKTTAGTVSDISSVPTATDAATQETQSVMQAASAINTAISSVSKN